MYNEPCRLGPCLQPVVKGLKGASQGRRGLTEGPLVCHRQVSASIIAL